MNKINARVAMLENILEPLARQGQLGASEIRTLNWTINLKRDHNDGLLHAPDTHFEGSAPHISTSHSTKRFSPIHFAEFPKSLQDATVSPDEEEFELSLFRLGLQFSTVASNYRLSVVLGENHNHLKFIHQPLRLALCAHGLFYSTVILKPLL
jgi:hypothetical protein